jgi:hypothetical protein
MAGIVVEYGRFVEAQQRRARSVPQQVHWPHETPAETNGAAPVDDQLPDLGELRRQSVSRPSAAALDRDSGSLDG